MASRRTFETVQVRRGRTLAYPLIIGPGALRRMVEDLARGRAGTLGRRPDRIAIISDAAVARLYGRQLGAALARAGFIARVLPFPPGESSKSREAKARLEDRLARMKFGRDGVIVALGGGVTGDLAGFVAATWHRGVSLIQAPTSLIAMLDAAIGGKVAVNHPLAKNLIGAFHPPAAVYADTRVLATLPQREFRSGLAEAVKCAVIADAALFRMIEKSVVALRTRAPQTVQRLVKRAAAVKCGIVSRDEKESGERMLLNFGHTLGHALEAAGRYRLRHGEAISIGMALEAGIAVRQGLLRERDGERIVRLLATLGLPVRLPRWAERFETVLDVAGRDKKVRGGEERYALPGGIGRPARRDAFVVHVPRSVVAEVLASATSGG